MKQLKIGIVISAKNEQGYNAILQIINVPLFLEICTPVLFGSKSAAQKAKESVKVEEESQALLINYLKDIKGVLDGRINVMPGYEEKRDSIDAAVKAYMSNNIDAIVVVPEDNKKGFDYKAVIEEYAKVIEAETKEVFTWRINDKVRVLNVKDLQIIPTVVKTLRRDFMFIKPKIAVMSTDASLHEQFKELREQGNIVFGPFDSDKVIEEGTYKSYDCLIFQNNDNAVQKLFGTVNPDYTYHYISGMPMVITAPIVNDNHGNIKQSIYAAIDIERARRKYRMATRSPLEKHWVPRGKDDFKLDLTKETD